METEQILVDLVRSTGLIALVALGYSWALRLTNAGGSRGIAVGVLLSLAGIASMSDPIVIAPGVNSDGRTIALAVAGSFGGVVAAIVAALAMSIYRLWIGGAGALAGVVGIIITATVGVLFALIPKRRLPSGWKRYGLLGACTSVSMFSLLLLPSTVQMGSVLGFALPRILANMLGCILVAEFLGREKQRLRMIRTLEQEATVDPLTQLPNRRDFDRRAGLAVQESLQSGRAFSVVMIDIDHFKRINDNWGHTVGDRILADTASVVRSCVRKTDIVARYGGEEIVILMPATDLVTAATLAEVIRVRVARQRHKTSRGELQLTVSVGAAASKGRLADIESVLIAADNALYRAKGNGRNQVAFDIAA